MSGTTKQVLIVVTRYLFVLFSTSISFSPLLAGVGQTTAATARQEQADLVVVGTIAGITVDAGNAVNATLLPVSVLKGDHAPASVPMKIIPSSSSSQVRGGFRSIRSGDTVLCMMRQVNRSDWEVLPLASGNYSIDDACRKIDSWSSVSQKRTLNQNILALLLEHYEALSGPQPDDDHEIFINLDHSTSLADALEVTSKLMASSVEHRRIVGFAAAIRLGSNDALSAIEKQLDSLMKRSDFPLIVTSLKTYYKPSGPGSVSALAALAGKNLAAPGWDAAIAAALERSSPVRETLPAMAQLLSSSDREAQMRAERVFARFTLFADSAGNIGQTIGPLSTDETRRNAPKYGTSAESISAYAVFWSSWWSIHKRELGF